MCALVHVDGCNPCVPIQILTLQDAWCRDCWFPIFIDVCVCVCVCLQLCMSSTRLTAVLIAAPMPCGRRPENQTTLLTTC